MNGYAQGMTHFVEDGHELRKEHPEIGALDVFIPRAEWHKFLIDITDKKNPLALDLEYDDIEGLNIDLNKATEGEGNFITVAEYLKREGIE